MDLQHKSKPTPMYWQSLEELNGDSSVLEAKHHEFISGVTEDFDPNELSGISRRRFLAAMGASAAFALTSCKNYLDKGEIIPYNIKPEEVTIGRPNYYASTVKTHTGASSVLIKTREGRPLFISGNPDHPVSQGALGAHYQAQIMHLYDPERLVAPVKGSAASNWAEAEGALSKALAGLKEKDQKALLLTHQLLSPTAKKAIDEFAKAYPTEVISYNVFHEGNRNAAWKTSYGTDNFPQIAWDQADVIVALESDFLGAESDDQSERLFASRRDVMTDKTFSRLYVVEGNLSATGMSSDYRLRLRPDAQYEFVAALASALAAQGVAIPAALTAKGGDLKKVAQAHGMAEASVKHLVEDLAKNKGKAIVHAGSRLPESVHIMVNAINDALGASVLYRAAVSPQLPTASDEQLKTLVADLKAGKYGVAIHWDTNPAYHLSSLGYADALAKAGVSVLLSSHQNETGVKSTYTLPIHHDLEAWGDYQTLADHRNLQQPVIAPLHDSRQAEGLLLAWAKGTKYTETLYLDYLKASWQQVHGQVKPLADFQTFWTHALHDGFVKLPGSAPKVGGFKADALGKIKEAKTGKDFVVSVMAGYATGDGQFANIGWLQEIPHPVSKIVWDNYAAMSLATAKELGVKTDDLVKVQVGNASVELTVLEQPGMADKVIAVEAGYGRTEAGAIASKVGVDVTPLLAFGSDSACIVGASVSKAEGKHQLVSSQLHHAFDVEREQDLHFSRKIVHEANYIEYQKDPHTAKMHGHEPINIFKPQVYEGIKWAMAIDMNKCNGCNACIMACNIENNVPVVGADQVNRGREMHWLRLDRYYSGTPEDPKVSLQMMLCQHCDNAPCEIVCPVNATNHSPDGLNQMAYNRCVGTRYCSNNCPYKVRRFNFFDYRDRFANAHYRKETFHLMHNPEVTVRSRGVMEKCTFCVQRIMWARQEAVRENRELKGSDVTVACQEVCPSQAIYFGDSNDPESSVSKYRKHVTGYHVLEEWNARPNVTYVAKLRNTYEA